MNRTDMERLNTLKALFNQEEKVGAQELPFSKSKLDYLRPLMIRLNQISGNHYIGVENHSEIMLRQMIDELLLEITAQINWSVGTGNTIKRQKVLGDFGLLTWNQFTNPFQPTTAQVA